MRACLAALAFATALPAGATLTDEKVAFSRATPCPSTGRQSTSCTGYVIVYPACEGLRANMRWATLAEAAMWTARAAVFCACRSYPVQVVSISTRGRVMEAVDCKLWQDQGWKPWP